MQKITYEREYFEPQSTLGCGQTFRFRPWREGYFVCAADRACYVYARGNETFVECEDADGDYFHHYFDLSRDYGEICRRAESYGIETVCAAYRKGRGLRILNQDEEETTFSFLVSQNNHIPRIKGILERIAERAGEEKIFLGERFFTFPKASVLAEKDERFFADLGAGYRAKYLFASAKAIAAGALRGAREKHGDALRAQLTALCGVGPKVADCIALFAYHDTGAFPVDTWVEKVYREDFHGALKDRGKIAAFFRELFGDVGGYIQQVLFYCKRGERS